MNTILVVDDQPEVREVVRTMLEARGFDVIVAANGENALSVFRRQPVAAALVDVDMPDMNGVELCRELRRTAEEIARPCDVSLMTGVMRPELHAAAAAAGACNVLPKPFTSAELVRQIRVMLERHALSFASR